jgi:hypothetical protein
MTLEAVFKDLAVKWERLVEELEHGLLWSVTQMKPEEDEHTLAHYYIDGATDLLDLACQGLLACRSVTAETSVAQAGKALVRCQERYNVLAERYENRLASKAELRRLRRFGAEKGDAWGAWAKQVADALVRCRQPMDVLNGSWFGCWQELTDRIGLQGVSVHAIGQQITVPKADAKAESIT